ncbi:hypothetical protein Rsub_09790 [Raphidocelis subcapitata]|uniref:FAD-binding FR-type domain-containing protein n=1 Tax=Raphidocelis subcapitata TaxID=307507 RepID=A0A2V0PGF8_9CHLO|nr:hypothetical protein Rsub_09790 [Raphidocelis subcapitata]|eukprot:GBF96993.1 hypothetical protein Rsub_09790 [Raphidocelis subcapitata]
MPRAQLFHRATQLAFGVAALFLAFWMLYSGTRVYLLHGPSSDWGASAYWEPRIFRAPAACAEPIGRNVLGPIFNTCQEERVLFSHLLFLWLTPVVLCLVAIALLASKASSRSAAPGELAGKPTWGARLIAPRRWWLLWCGGLTAGDLLIICCWLLVNALWLNAVLRRNQALQVAKLAKRSWPHTPITHVKLLGKSLGMLLYPNLVLLLVPAARGSVLLQAAGISYPAAVRYHRWLGHAVMWISTVHGLLYYAAWLAEGKFLAELLEREPNVNKLFGSVSLAFGVLLWAGSLEWVRRRHYARFKALHFVGFAGFFVFGCAHTWSLAWYFVPGLALYAVEVAYRATQAAANTTKPKRGRARLLQAAAAPDGGACTLVLAADDYCTPPSGCVWLCVPEVCRAQWHPFTFVRVPRTDGAAGHAMLIQIKAYSRWTHRLVALVAAGGMLTVKIQGPYAESHDGPAALVGPEGGADGVIILAGGLGVAPAMSILSELAGAAVSKVPVLFVWSCRKAQELEFVSPPVVAMLQALDSKRLTSRLYITAVPSQTASLASVESKGLKDEAGDCGMSPAVACQSPWASAALQAVLHLAVFAGMFAGLALARYLTSMRPRMPLPTAMTGLAYAAAVTLLPAAAGTAMLAVTVAISSAKRARGAPGAAAWPPTTPVAAAAAAAVASGVRGQVFVAASPHHWPAHYTLLVPLEPGAPLELPVTPGRPALDELVRGWLAGLRQLPLAADGRPHRVLVYAAGPDRLVQSAQLLCDDVNARSPLGVHLYFVRRSHEL